MPRYASFDSAATQPTPVIGWYDTDFADYPNLPLPENLLLLNDAQWEDRRINPNAWAVSAGELVAYVRPIPILTHKEQAANVLAIRIATGIVLTCTGNPALNATYAIDDNAERTIAGLLTAIANPNVGTPGGGETFNYLDITGTAHAFTITQFEALAKAIMNLCYVLNTQAGIMASGGAEAWPVQTVTIP